MTMTRAAGRTVACAYFYFHFYFTVYFVDAFATIVIHPFQLGTRGNSEMRISSSLGPDVTIQMHP